MGTESILHTLRKQARESRLLDQARDLAERYIAGVRSMRVIPDAQAVRGLESLPTALPQEPTDPSRILEMLHRYGSPATTAQTGGRYFGFVNGGSLPAAIAARWLADAWDQNAAMYVMSPVSSALEARCEKWLVSLLGLPPETAMGLVGGTSIATLCGLAAGRDELLRRAGWDCGARGLLGAPEIRVVLGAQAHASVSKALGLLGLGRDRVERVPVDGQGRIVPAHLPRMDGRTLLILQAGNVSTGAFDPFAAIVPAAREAGAWIHVDGAFGLWAAASPRFARLMEGAALADSWSADAHKTLNAPYDNGIVFCRHREALAAAMRVTGAYLSFSEDRDGMMYTPDMSRRARGIDLWATLLSLGRSGAAELVEGLCGLADLFARLMAREGFVIQNEVVFNQVLVTCATPELTTRTLTHMQASGECWCGGTTWNNDPAIRISVCSYATTEEDVERSVRAFVAAREKAGRTE
ncbi:MAG: pyridoxal-dependent decarboxylase [Spirochaetia bacterium]|jgi:glutamate/tyrosine decarboxylase-like PLP-dependent enzyme